MFFKMLSVDRMRLFRRPLWRNTVIVLLVLPIIVTVITFLIGEGYIGNASSAERRDLIDSITWPTGIEDLVESQPLSIGILSALFLMFIIPPLTLAKSYRDRTMQNWVMRGVHRPQILLAKYVNLLGLFFLTILIPFVVAGVLTLIFTLIKGETINIAEVDWAYMVRQIVILLFSWLIPLSITFLVIVLTRSAVAAIAGVLLFSFALQPALIGIIERFFGDTFAEAIKFFPLSLETSLESWAEQTTRNSELLAPGWAAVLLLLYTLLFFVCAILAFRHQDLGG